MPQPAQMRSMRPVRMRWTRWSAPLAITLAATAQAAAATTVTIGASQDVMIFGTPSGADTGNASGRGPAMFAGADASGNFKRSLISFDVAAALPANAVISNVTMTLFLGQIAGSGGGSGGGNSNYPSRTIRLYDLLQPWAEGSSGSPTQPTVGGTGQGYPRASGDTTWDYASYSSTGGSIPWRANGIALHGGNFSSVESAASTFTSFVLNTPYTWNSAGMVADVQGWLDGSAANNGWLIKSDLETSPQSFLGFWTKDGAAANNNPAIAPRLSIEYSVAVVPEPASLALLAGGLAFVAAGVRRRRKHG